MHSLKQNQSVLQSMPGARQRADVVARPPEAERKRGASSSWPGFGAGTWAQAEGGDLRNEAAGGGRWPKAEADVH